MKTTTSNRLLTQSDLNRIQTWRPRRIETNWRRTRKTTHPLPIYGNKLMVLKIVNTLISGILHKQTRDQNKRPYTQIVLPTIRRQEVIRLAHSTPMAENMGYKRTKYKIMKNFFWPGMGKEIQNACQSCERCQKTAKKSSYVAPMQKTPTITELFHKVASDVVGPLPLTKRKNQYILTYMDLASR